MAIIKKSAPWVTCYKEINELFKEDDDVFVVYEEDDNTVNVYVEDETKASAIRYLLPTEKEFGNVTLFINVLPSNKGNYMVNVANPITVATDAFRNNDAVVAVTDVSCVFPIAYVVFKRKVVQYFDDNLSDINGNCSTLYETMAKNIFNDVGIKFCTSNR